MAKRILKVVTEAGEFTRATATAYQFAVVRTSERAKDYIDRVAAGSAEKYTDGIHGRWLKDRGHAVTWHNSEKAARAAAAKPYTWDSKTKLVGVFPVAA